MWETHRNSRGNHNTLEIPPDTSDVWFQGNRVGTGMTKTLLMVAYPAGAEILFLGFLFSI